MKQPSESLHGCVLGPLCIWDGCWLGVLTVGVGAFLTLLLELGTPFLLLGSLAQPYCEVCAWSDGILLCHVQLMSLGGLLFFWEEMGGGSGSGGDGR